MKTSLLLLALLTIISDAHSEELTPSQLDSARTEARDKVFTSWGTSEDANGFWNKLAKENVPVYKEFKDAKLSRDLYIPNPGIGYWVLGGMTEQAFWETEREKLKIGDERSSTWISASGRWSATMSCTTTAAATKIYRWARPTSSISLTESSTW